MINTFLTEKYIRPPAATINRSTKPAEDIPSPTTSQAPSTNQLLLQIIQKLDRLEEKGKQMEHRNKRRFIYLKELIIGNHPPKEDPDTPDSTSFTSTGSHDGPDGGDAATSPLCS
ncbi:hypothetical protein AHAS_Ahas13G0275300 [Arachis hypogaea]